MVSKVKERRGLPVSGVSGSVVGGVSVDGSMSAIWKSADLGVYMIAKAPTEIR
jgi:hypothetical protein